MGATQAAEWEREIMSQLSEPLACELACEKEDEKEIKKQQGRTYGSYTSCQVSRQDRVMSKKQASVIFINITCYG